MNLRVENYKKVTIWDMVNDIHKEMDKDQWDMDGVGGYDWEYDANYCVTLVQ